jgi:threonine synthase
MKKAKSKFNFPKTKLKIISEGKYKVYFKLEYQVGYGSFKTRAARILISKALKEKYSKVFAYTSGNLGLGISELAKENDLFSNITINNRDYPKMHLLKKYASQLDYKFSNTSVISRVLGFACAILGIWDVWWFFSNKSTFEDKANNNFFLAQPSIYINPESLFGYSETSWETYKQLGGKGPDYVITPIINSDNAIGQWLGYYSLYKEGKLSKIPHFILVEQKKIVKHFNYPDAWSTIKKISAVSTYEVDNNDEKIAKKYLKTKYNIVVEDVSAGVWKASNDLIRNNFIKGGSTTVLILSGANV